jgi:hypothetical protein
MQGPGQLGRSEAQPRASLEGARSARRTALDAALARSQAPNG